MVILATSTFQEVNLKVSPKGEGFNPIIQTINRKRLAQNLVDYYGKEFLILFDAYSSGTCAWIRQIIDHNEAFQHPLHHLLLIHFLGGSAEAFFKGSGDTPPEYLPFGVPPYPCRNFVCEYHLRDVINEIEIIKVLGMPCATFICPYCGFSYKRKGSIPKENQYSGRIRIVNYGRKWEETVIMLLTEGLSPYQIARIVHCAIPTVLTFGIEHKLLPSELLIKRYPYIPVYPTQAKPDFNARRNHYRRKSPRRKLYVCRT